MQRKLESTTMEISLVKTYFQQNLQTVSFKLQLIRIQSLSLMKVYIMCMSSSKILQITKSSSIPLMFLSIMQQLTNKEVTVKVMRLHGYRITNKQMNKKIPLMFKMKKTSLISHYSKKYQIKYQLIKMIWKAQHQSHYLKIKLIVSCKI